MDWFFVGDAHFASGDGKRRAHFFRFIKKNKPALHTLVIMGDFFDFWFGFRNLAPLKKQYKDLLDLLKVLRADGVRVIYLEGNHDFCMGPYMTEELGIEVYERSAEIDLDGRRVYLAHGDLVHPPMSHRLFTWCLRNRVTYGLISFLGPRVVIAIAKQWSAGSRGRNMERSPEIIDRLRLFAERKLHEGFDTVILAHSHLPEAITIDTRGGEGTYFNVGNWMQDFSYLRYNEKRGFSLEYDQAE